MALQGLRCSVMHGSGVLRERFLGITVPLLVALACGGPGAKPAANADCDAETMPSESAASVVAGSTVTASDGYIETEEDRRRTRCRLTQFRSPRDVYGRCVKDFDGVEELGLSMPSNSCAMIVEAGTYPFPMQCTAHILPDGSRMIRLRGGGGRIRATHSYSKQEFTARDLSRPPLNENQRFDVSLGCSGQDMTFEQRPGHSARLAEVRVESLSAEDSLLLQQKTGNDWRAVGALTIYKWSEEEVMGVVEAISIRPSNNVIPVQMAFRLDWQQGGDVRKLLDCEPYRGWQKVLTEPLPKPAATQ